MTEHFAMPTFVEKELQLLPKKGIKEKSERRKKPSKIM